MALARHGAHGEADGLIQGRGGESAVEATLAGQGRPTRQPPAHRRRRVRPYGLEKPLAPESVGDGGRHAMTPILFYALRIPEVMGNEFQKQRFRRWPGVAFTYRFQLKYKAKNRPPKFHLTISRLTGVGPCTAGLGKPPGISD